jgi:PKD repeat protein
MRTLLIPFLTLLLGQAHAQGTVCDQLQAGFTVSENTTTLFFSNATVGTGQGTQFFWSFGDGATSQDPQPIHTYQPGTYQVCLTALTLLPGDNGQFITCVDTTCTVITINAPQCDPNFVVELAWNAGPGNTVFFTATSSEPDTWYTWYFSNLGTANGSSATWTFPGPGTYNVCVTGWTFNSATNDTCVTEDCTLITVAGNDPCAELNAGFIPSVGGLGVNLQNTVVNNTWTYLWNFGDGTTGYGPNTGHQYNAPGVYDICLTVYTWSPITQDTCFVELCQVITIGGTPCSPNFIVEMDAQSQGNGLVTFVATSSFPNTNFIWYFGDGTQAFGPTANHTYTEDGTYGVCVTGWYFNEATQDTCWIEDCEPVVVSGTPCNGLDACFVTNDLGDGMYFFDNCSSTDGNAQYFWDFGDGTSSTVVNAEHLYELPGVYSVCLTVYEGNCVDSTCTVISIAGPCNSLLANFGWSLAGAQAEFDNVTVPVGLSTTWLWNFGDGSTSTENSPAHLYTAPGTYQACLTATSILEGGYICTDTYCVTVVVQGVNPCQTLQADFGSFAQGLGVELVNSSFGLGFQTTYFWTFGDGQSSTAPSPAHLYAVPGTYEVCLTVISLYTSPGGTITCQDIYCAPVVILGNDPCDPNFAVELAWNAGTNNTVFLTGGSNQPNTNFIWYLGDGNEAFGSSVSHTYAEGGNYTVCLAGWYYNVATGDSCWAEDCAIITVGSGNPCDSLNACFVTNELGNGAYFFDNCTGGALGTQYFWTFGDGATSTVIHVDHQYSEPGTYEVCLTAFWQQCSDTTCTTVTVFGDEPCELLSAGYEYFANGLAIQFVSATAGASPQSTFTWSFGDGATGSGPNPMHDYSLPGTYEVCLHVESIYAFPGQPVVVCEDEICSTVVVGNGVFCDQLAACFEPLPFENGAYLFENCSQLLPIAVPATYFWNFGDGSTSTDAAPTHAFAPGIYSVCLVITQSECVDSTCTTITVNSGGACDPNYSASFTYEVQNNAVIFFANTAEPTLGWIWTFPDGVVAYEPIHTHLFEPPGPYEVCLSTWYWNEQTQDTCWAHTCQWIDPFDVVNSVGELDDTGISVFPNPAHDQLTITGLPTRATLQLFSPDGRLVRSAQPSSDTHRLPVQDLATGTYLLVMQANGERAYRRVVVE